MGLEEPSDIFENRGLPDHQLNLVAITLRGGPPLRIVSAIAYQDHTDPPQPNEGARSIGPRVREVLQEAGFVVADQESGA